MRAPPVAVKQMKGTFCSMAVSTPRTKRSPTTLPIEPPMNSNSKQAATTLDPDKLVWVVVGDLKQVEQPVRSLELGPVQVIDADGNPVKR